jgi:hypothetical protein
MASSICEVFDLGDLETTTVMLHPTFDHFRIADVAGRVADFRYRIECSRHLEAPHAEHVRAFARLSLRAC